MSNFVCINIISMTHYDKELNPGYTSYGYKISDDYTSAFCDVWNTLEEFRDTLKKYHDPTDPRDHEDIHKSLVIYLATQCGEVESDIIVGAIDNNWSIYIGNDVYNSEEISLWLEVYRAKLV